MITAVFKSGCIVFWRLNSEIRTIPFKTATPNNAMKPTPAEILKFISLNQSERIPPIAESGMAEKMSNPYFTELNAKYSINKIKNKLTGTAIAKRDFAC